MEKNLYDKVLNALYTNGIGYETDISTVFDKSFLQPNAGNLIWSKRVNFISEFLSEMKTNGHLDYREPAEIKQNDKEVWMYPLLIKATITRSGFEYIENRNLYKKTVESFKYTKWLSIIAIIISIVAIYFSTHKESSSIKVAHQNKEGQKNFKISQLHLNKSK